MPDDAPTEPAALPARPMALPSRLPPRLAGLSRLLRGPVGAALGLLLVAAAVLTVVLSLEDAAPALSTLRAAHPGLIVLLFALPLAVWVTTSLSLYFLTTRFGTIRPGEMLALIGSAGLLNYLPMRPGLVGRVAYHKKFNRVSVRDTLRVSIEGAVLTIVWTAALLVVGLIARALDHAGAHPALNWSVILAPVALGLLAPAFVGASPHRAKARDVAWAVGVRGVDALLWAARYLVCFALLGHPLGVADAVLIAAASQAALLIPISGNGLGIREWAVALAAAATVSTAAETPDGTDPAKALLALALAADLVHRLAELATAVPLGLICLRWVARRLKSPMA